MARILLADDEASIRILVSRVLRQEGHEVYDAKDGQEAIEQYLTIHPDLLLTDLIMPVKEGIETILEVRKFDPNARIIVMTGGGRTNPAIYLGMAKALGAAEVLAKPFTVEQLNDVINKVLGLVVHRPGSDPISNTVSAA